MLIMSILKLQIPKGFYLNNPKKHDSYVIEAVICRKCHRFIAFYPHARGIEYLNFSQGWYYHLQDVHKVSREGTNWENHMLKLNITKNCRRWVRRIRYDVKRKGKRKM